MREGGHYSLFIISCEKSIDGKTSLLYEKRTQKANKGGEDSVLRNNEPVCGKFFASGRRQETNNVGCVALSRTYVRNVRL